jgi:NitT/TauT family transport system substrate-binding protein
VVRGRRGAIAATLALAGVLTAAFAGTSGARPHAAAAPRAAAADKVTLQLKWVTQAQFAGFYAAKAMGYYTKNNLDVKLKVGGPDITPEQVVASGGAEFGIDWLPALLAARDKGGDLVNIAQVFGKSGMTELTWKPSGITSINGLKGKKVGVWCCGNENELYAALVKNGLDPHKDVTIVNQPFDMTLFLSKSVDAAAAMTYNELAQVLETKNPDTGKLYSLSDLNVIKMQNAGTAMLEDGIFSTGKWLGDSKHQDVAKRFIAASLQGWVYCRDHQAACLKIILDNGPTLGAGHQRWMLNEVNALIWPSPGGVGVMRPADFKRTADIAKQFKVIKKPAANAAYRTDLAKAAVSMLKAKGVDTTGASWKPAAVKVTAGGK